MAVYTHLSADRLAALIAQYDVGDLVSVKGIAEGVSNSNWLVETSQARFILTMYEARVDASDLPFFLGLLDHLADKGNPVPRTIHDRGGAAFREVGGKAVALIEFLPGVSVDQPTAAQAREVGRTLAGVHLDAADFPLKRANTMALPQWRELLADCATEGLRSIDPSLPELVSDELDHLSRRWPTDLPTGVIHADLFPDNVLLLEDRVTGLIDFYFACTDIIAYDLVVTHAAWCFTAAGAFRPEIAQALLSGYVERRPLSAAEWKALPLLARGASMRFLATRAYDWLHTPPEALVTRKDPMDFVRRLSFYASHGEAAFPRRPAEGAESA